MLASHSRRDVPLLVFRSHNAGSGFAAAARDSVRRHDLVAHDPRSRVVVLAIVDDRGVRKTPSGQNCRAALHRICARIAAAGRGSAIESGWTIVRPPGGEDNLHAAIGCAFERGAQERERRDFLAVVGHELRTPLASIRAHLESLLEKDLAPTTQRFLQSARDESLRMGRLLDNVFEFSLLEFSPAADAAGCALATVTAAACAMLAPVAASRGVAVSNRIRSGAWVALDSDACVHALVNLLDNAIKYARSYGRVRLSARIETAWVHVAVEDDGDGLAACDREHVFGMRVQGTAARRPGTGIGLAIVAAIARRAGGDVRVLRSVLGGARFVLRLPRKAEFAETAS